MYNTEISKEPVKMTSPRKVSNVDNQHFLKERLQLRSFNDYKIFPLYYEMETVNACNARCSMCTINKWEKHETPYMDSHLFEKIADELINYSQIVRTVNLSRDGEPLLDKDIEDKINYLKQGGINHVNFSTNASLLTEKRSKNLLNSQLDEIMFSIDGFTKETFEKIRIGLNFDKVIENVHRFIKLRNDQNSKIKIRVRLVVQEKNKHEVADWGKYWRKYLCSQDHIHAKNIHSWGNQLDNYRSIKEDKKLLTPCTSPFSTMIIRFNGDVTICPLDFDFKYINGNITKGSIKEIWQKGLHYKEFRKIHLESGRDDLDFCKGCRLWEPDKTKRVF